MKPLLTAVLFGASLCYLPAAVAETTAVSYEVAAEEESAAPSEEEQLAAQLWQEVRPPIACSLARTALALDAGPGGPSELSCWTAFDTCAETYPYFFSSGMCSLLNEIDGCVLPCD